MDAVVKELRKLPKHRKLGGSMTFAFVEASEMKALNKKFRGKNKVTDILSFDGFEDGDLGDLVLCGAIVDSQSKAHQLTVRQELGYLAIHGLLHLLGYDHESGGPEADTMFALQDKVFEKIWPRFFKEPFHV